MYRYALQFDIVAKNCAEFVRIGNEDDTESGVPFTAEERQKLWDLKDEPFVDTILIYHDEAQDINERIYSLITTEQLRQELEKI